MLKTKEEKQRYEKEKELCRIHGCIVKTKEEIKFMSDKEAKEMLKKARRKCPFCGEYDAAFCCMECRRIVIEKALLNYSEEIEKEINEMPEYLLMTEKGEYGISKKELLSSIKGKEKK